MGTTMVARTLKCIQRDSNISCREMASIVGVSPSAISRYGVGDREIPEDIIVSIANKGGFDELKIAYLAEKRLDIINAPVLNNIDDNIHAMVMKLCEEIDEARDALLNISKITMNRKYLDDKKLKELEMLTEQVADLIPGVKTFLIKIKSYGVNLEAIDMTICQKLRARNYVEDI